MKKKLCVIFLILFLACFLGLFLWGNRDRFFAAPLTETEINEFKTEIHTVMIRQKWTDPGKFKRKLTGPVLLASFKKGRDFLLANQKPAGNFNYEYDFTSRTFSRGDNQVRQAGALWGLATCYRFDPNDKNRVAIEKGFEFYFTYTKPWGENGLIIDYPGSPITMTGTVALVSLAIVDYLRANPPLADDMKRKLESHLDGYLAFLVGQQFKSGQFSLGVVHAINMKIGQSNPYFNGETLLALIKAAKYTDHKELIPVIEKAAPFLAKKYTVIAWAKDADSTRTKGFYQWGSMAFWEYQDAGWKNAEIFRDTTLAMGWWMIYTHKTLGRSRNTAYAYEGLVHAWLIAKDKENKIAQARLRRTLDRGLYKLTTWQVEGPLRAKNEFLNNHRTNDLQAIGGIMNHKSQAPLRIDVTQHQMHAVSLALEHVYHMSPKKSKPQNEPQTGK